MRFFNAENSLDYYSFGMLIPERNGGESYRYNYKFTGSYYIYFPKYREIIVTTNKENEYVGKSFNIKSYYGILKLDK